MIAVVVAAGSSRRMGFDKLSVDLHGKPLAAWSLIAFERSQAVQGIVVVTQEDRIAEFRTLGVREGISKLCAVINGGSERHLSVWNGIQAAKALEWDAEFIAVHDAARPLIMAEEIDACLELARLHGAAAAASPVVDTLKRADAEGFVAGSVDRNQLWAMQTPQIFRFSLLEEAYREILRNGATVTDEVSAVEALGHRVALYDNPEPNFKVTLPADVDLARFVLSHRPERV